MIIEELCRFATMWAFGKFSRSSRPAGGPESVCRIAGNALSQKVY